MCTDNIFKAMELKACRAKREMLKKDKAPCKSAEDVDKKALAILEILEANTGKKLTGTKLQMMLLFCGVKKKKHGKNVAEMRAKYKESKEKNTAPIEYKKWTDVDKAELTKVMDDKIIIDETELGRQRAQLKQQKKEELAAFAQDNREEAAQILSLMSSYSSSAVLSASANPNAKNPNMDLDETNNLDSNETVVPLKPWL